MQNKLFEAAVCVLILGLSNISMIAQTYEPSASQSVSGATAQSNGISDSDIEMLRSDFGDHRFGHAFLSEMSQQ
jgi:hypothetical protein